MSTTYSEADYENSIIELFQDELEYEYVYGPDIVDRDYKSPLYEEELENAIYRINKDLPSAAIEDALDKLRNFENAELIQKNETFMNYLQNGIEVRYFEKGEEKSEIVYIVDLSLIHIWRCRR